MYYFQVSPAEDTFLDIFGVICTGQTKWKTGIWDLKLNETNPVQQKHSTFIHVEMGFDALWLSICVFQETAAHTRQFDCGQVQRAKHAATTTPPP